MRDTIIIPDVHEDFAAVQRALARFAHIRRRIFLGDWFDSFTTHGVGAAVETARMVKDLVKDKRNIMLLGNHDVSYWWGAHDRRHRCPGYTGAKSMVVNGILVPSDWAAFRLSAWAGPFLCSHAGFHRKVLGKAMPSRSWLLAEERKILFDAAHGISSPMLARGFCRGGDRAVGGPLWLDWDHEFQPVDGLSQIVGHTPSRTVRFMTQPCSANLCIDTQLRHVAVVSGGVVEIVSL